VCTLVEKPEKRCALSMALKKSVHSDRWPSKKVCTLVDDSQECTFCHEHSRVYTVHSRAQTVPLMDSMCVEIMHIWNTRQASIPPARICGHEIFANRPSFCPCGLSAIEIELEQTERMLLSFATVKSLTSTCEASSERI
jgi:hypothetical protein